jgi:peptide/nickel transport system ATP-binding protein
MIFQDPMMTLNPVMRIGTQMIEALLAHQPALRRYEARRRCVDALAQVGIASPAERLNAYPHQFSGGMRQRIAIAIAFLNKPDLIIADEPTTALDVTIQAQILSEVQKLCRESGTALIWISHDLSVVAGLADDICVMYAGRIVERGSVGDVLDHPLHPYTSGLLAALPRPETRGRPFTQIPGAAPVPIDLPRECGFLPRCPRATDECRSDISMIELRPSHFARCIHPQVEGA